MMNSVIEFVIHTLGFVIIWHLILRGEKFTLYSRKVLYTFLLVILAVELIKFKL